jgi:hypothetical protein
MSQNFKKNGTARPADSHNLSGDLLEAQGMNRARGAVTAHQASLLNRSFRRSNSTWFHYQARGTSSATK